MHTEPLIALDSVGKRFGGNEAVSGVSLELSSGEIVALVGENGAGKTTLMKIAAGLIAPDAGRLIGTAITSKSVAMVHQHFNLVDSFTVSENLTLADSRAPFFLPLRERSRIAGRKVAASGLATVYPERMVEDLSVGEKAKLELTKALAGNPSLLILDEPTGVLTAAEIDDLRTIVRSVQARLGTVVLITHKIPEVFSFATRVIVLREGRLVLDRPLTDATPEQIANAMIGAQPRIRELHSRQAGEPLLNVKDVSTETRIHEVPLRDVSLEVRAGEIVTVLGVTGNGQQALARLLRGIDSAASGTISYRKKVMNREALARARRIGHIAEDRALNGLIGPMSIAENFALVLERGAGDAQKVATEMIERFRIRATSAFQKAETLSGGNQQKVLLARELLREPDLLVLSEPTRGLDFEATTFVHGEISKAAARGCGVLLITSDLDEAYALGDRFHVMFQGTMSESLSRDEVERTLASRMGGLF